MDLQSNTVNSFVSKNVLLFKKIFICLPVNGLMDYDVSTHKSEICEKVERYFPGCTVVLENDDNLLEVPQLLMEPKVEGNLEYLGENLLAVADSDLVIFGVGWSSSRFCTMVHCILEEYNEVPYMYEWELDLPDSFT